MKAQFVPGNHCNGKKCYTKRDAQTMRNTRIKKGHDLLRIYPCPRCNWWHLTSLNAHR